MYTLKKEIINSDKVTSCTFRKGNDFYRLADVRLATQKDLEIMYNLGIDYVEKTTKAELKSDKNN